MQNKQVTVFGGTGFLGRYIIQSLAQQGALIKVATRTPAKVGFLKPLGQVGQISPIAIDYAAPQSLQAAIQNSVAVINTLGILYETGRQKFTRVHEDIPAQLAKIAAKEKVQDFIHISALGAHKASPSAYAASKAAGEEKVLKAFTKAIILRPSLVFGPEDKFFNLFATLATYSPMLALPGGGSTRFQPVYVKDIANAVVTFLKMTDKSPSPYRGKIFELGGPKVYTFKELIQFILRTIHRQRLLVSIPFGLMHYIASILQYLPNPLITPDQNVLLQQDNVVGTSYKTFTDLNISPRAIEDVVPNYLRRLRPHD